MSSSLENAVSTQVSIPCEFSLRRTACILVSLGTAQVLISQGGYADPRSRQARSQNRHVFCFVVRRPTRAISQQRAPGIQILMVAQGGIDRCSQ